MSKVVAEHLQAIYENRGQLTARDVVEEASNPLHPLHVKFEWDDGVAAAKHREAQAKRLIRSCKIVYRQDTSPQSKVRQFTHVERRTDGVHTYVPSVEVAQDPVAYRTTLNQMKREWASFRNRYKNFQEFGEIIRAEAAQMTGPDEATQAS